MAKKKHGSSVKDDDKYEALRRKGMSKQRAARISNAGKSASRKGGRKSGGSKSGGSKSGGSKSGRGKSGGRKKR